MSLSSALNVALSGLQTSTTLMQITANNISNAQTPGYTKKSANVSSTALGGQVGGSEITTYTRATNTVLQQSYNTSTTGASYLSTQNNYMQQIQTILNSSANNPALSTAIANFSSAWTQLQASPEDPTVQQAVVQAGITFAQQVNSISGQVGSLQAQVTSDTKATVTQLNTDLNTIYSLNQQIFTANAENLPTGNLEDQRDQAVNQIASITNIQVFQRSQGQIALYTSDGVALLDGTPQTLTYNGATVTDSNGQDITADLSGGSLQAQLQFNATATTPSSVPGVNTIQKIQAQLVDLVKAFTSNGTSGTFANAYNPSGPTSDNFFTSTGNDPGSFAVNSSLVTDPSTIPTSVVTATANTFGTNYNFTDASAGLSLDSGTYTGLVTTILSGFQQAANSISTQSQSATQQKSYYQQALSNATGVNVDTELVNLTTLQNSYAASAHVISTIAQMFNDLLATI